MKAPMHCTLPSFSYNSGIWVFCGVITCQCNGEWADGTKVWSNLANGDQYSKVKVCGKFAFLLEARA